MTERTFDWRPPATPDPRNYSMAPLLDATTGTVESRNWAIRTRLDQGREGSCVGNGIAHDLAGYPHPQHHVDEAFAVQVYELAKTLDDTPGEAYDGTSVIAGCKAARELGRISAYRQIPTLDQLLLALSHVGPVVLGCWWTEGMETPDADGRISPTGARLGGHCVCIHGYHVADDRIKIRNSWGEDWGKRGDCFVSTVDLLRMFMDQGEAWTLTKAAL